MRKHPVMEGMKWNLIASSGGYRGGGGGGGGGGDMSGMVRRKNSHNPDTPYRGMNTKLCAQQLGMYSIWEAEYSVKGLWDATNLLPSPA